MIYRSFPKYICFSRACNNFVNSILSFTFFLSFACTRNIAFGLQAYKLHFFSDLVYLTQTNFWFRPLAVFFFSLINGQFSMDSCAIRRDFSPRNFEKKKKKFQSSFQSFIVLCFILRLLCTPWCLKIKAIRNVLVMI